MLENRDYTLIVDRSGSMSTQDCEQNQSRWNSVRDSAIALASKCEEFDPDGITVYLFSSTFRRYDNVTTEKVAQIFDENQPVGRTNLAEVLEHAFENFFERRKKGETKPNGETMLVITDGEPDDRKAVMKEIVRASRQIDRDEELAVSFIQVGTDPKVTEYLKALDDNLVDAGAKFDIVDTIDIATMKNRSLSDVLLDAIID
ncbi:MAG: VWA domain-containing protein [Coleofasciculaceae cyanobacterium RL_1_1]|nr:VWA domain-containing protein [Coleofasciculaceae cyanobacterium RL_1_1]